MKDEDKEKEQLIQELTDVRRRVAEMEALRAEYKKTQETLKVMKAAMEACINAAVLADLEGSLTCANRSFLRMWGYENHKEVIGKSALELLGNEGAAAEVLEALNVKESWEGQMVAKRKDGSLFDVQLSASRVLDDAGKPVCMMASFIDITARKKAEEALREREEQYRRILENVRDIVYSCYVDGTVYFVSPNVRSIAGYRPEEVVGHNFMEFVHPDDRERVSRDYEKTLATGEEFPTTFRLSRKDGSYFYVEELGKAVREGDKLVGLTGVLRDITERKKAEEELREAIAVKANFISTVSHELRTPLAAIKEGISIVSDETAGALTKEQEEFLDIAKTNVDRLVRLINDILDFQRLDSEKGGFALQDNDMNEAVKEAYDTHLPVAKAKGLDFSIRLADNLPRVKFDKDKILQVLTNLIDNAIKFTQKGSIAVSITRGTNIIQVSVQDTGPGIKKEDLAKLFQSFARLGQAGGAAAPGTGLGLAISKAIIERHKGKIWAESEVGKGATFHFLLPIKERRG